MKTPIAPQREHIWKRPTGDFLDPWAWLAEKDNPATLNYLREENEFSSSWLSEHSDLVTLVFEEIKSRVQETDVSVPVQYGPWWYVTKTIEGLPYGIHCRGLTKDSATSVVLLDENKEAEGHEFFALQTFDISSDHNLLAWSADFDGSEQSTILFRDLNDNKDLGDRLDGTTWGGSAWSSANDYFFYVTPDDAMRPYRVWRHQIGTLQSEDELIFEELDERFFVGVGLSRSEQIIMIESSSKTTSECHIIRSDFPTEAPMIVRPRTQDLEYSVDHWGDRLVITTNENAVDFKVCTATLRDPHIWTDFIAHIPGRRIVGTEAFSTHLVVSSWTEGQQTIHIVAHNGESTRLPSPPEPHEIEIEQNPNWVTSTLRFSRQSLVEPAGVFEYKLDTGETELLKQTPTPNVQLANYVSRRVWADSHDGVKVPVDIVHHKDTPINGTAPCLIYSYGAYEISTAPWFSVARLSLLDRGFVWALVHPRGGGEMGRNWYFNGRLLTKKNTFADVNSAASHLVEINVANHNKLMIRGGSAGGLLVGACINRDPDLYRVAIAEVPFVDVVTTMSDPSMPLTVTEWEEWGDPRMEPWASYMLSYSPYDNLSPRSYPAIFATAGLNDPRVSFHEPAKWIAKIRSLNEGQRPVLFKCEMGAGHGGPSGRYDRWREEAEILTFLIVNAKGA